MRYLTVAGGVFLMFVVSADIALALGHHQPTPVSTAVVASIGTPSADPTATPGPTDAATPTSGPTDTATPSPQPTDTALPDPTSTPSAPAGNPVIRVPVRPRTPTPVTHVTTKKTTVTTKKATTKTTTGTTHQA